MYRNNPLHIFHLKKILLWTIGSIIGLVIVVLLAFRLSPWPGALIIRQVFTNNAAKVHLALEKHQPTQPVTTIADQVYRPKDTDARLDVYFPAQTVSAQPVIIWTHGGAWLSGDKSDYAPYFKLLAARGFTVIVPNYTLAPEATYPTQLFQLNDVYSYLQAQAARFHADTSQIFFAGDSAGSQLSAQMAAMITNPAYAREVGINPHLTSAQLKGVILNCGIYKMAELATPEPTLPKIVGWGDDVAVWSYSGSYDFNNPVIHQMSPYYHVTGNFPPTYISGGNADPLTNVQSKPFAAELTLLGVSVTTLFFPENHQPALPHEYQFNLDNDDGMQALDMTAAFVKAHVK